MTKKNKKRLIIVGITLLLIFIFPIASFLLFKNSIKDILVEKINNKIDAVFSVNDFDVSIFSNFPQLTVSLYDVSLTGIDDLSTDTLMVSKSVDVMFSVSKILIGKYEIKEVIVDGAFIKPKTFADGKTNWDILKKDTITDLLDGDTIEEIEKINIKGMLLVDRITFCNSNLVYEDQTSETILVLDGINGSVLGQIVENKEPLNLTVASDVTLRKNGITILQDIDLDINLFFSLDQDAKSIDIFKSSFLLNQFKLSVLGSINIKESNSTLFNVDITSAENTFSDFLSFIYLSNKEIDTKGKVLFNGSVKGLLKDKLLPSFDFSLIVEDACIRNKTTKSTIDDINLKMIVENIPVDSLNNISFQIAPFCITNDSNRAEGYFLFNEHDNIISVGAELNASVDLSVLSQILPSNNSIKLEGILKSNLNIENSKFTGLLQLKNFDFIRELNSEYTVGNLSLSTVNNLTDISVSGFKYKNTDLMIRAKGFNLLAFFLYHKSLNGNLLVESDNLESKTILGKYSINTSVSINSILDPVSSFSAKGVFTSPSLQIQNLEKMDELAFVTKDESLKKIVMKDLNVSFSVKNRSIQIDPFRINLEKGNFIDMEADLTFDQNIDCKGSFNLNLNPSQIQIPFSVKGSINEPKIDFETKSILGSLTNNILRK